MGVRFGEAPEMYLGPDIELTREGFFQADVDLGMYAGETGNLTFTLVSRGEPGAVLEVCGIEIIENDDVEGDGLTTAEELAAGTSPQFGDTDGDGWDDRYELCVSGTNPIVADSDRDGQVDRIEFEMGTDPWDGGSRFAVTGLALEPGGGLTLRWPGKIGRKYRVLQSDSPDFLNYDVIGSEIPGGVPSASFSVPPDRISGRARSFFRVQGE